MGAQQNAWTLVALAALISPGSARARDLWESDNGAVRLTLDSSFRSTLVFALAPHDPVFFPEETGGASLFRLRFDATAELGEHVTAQVAYMHSTRSSSAAADFAGVLPASAGGPYRLVPVEQTLIDRAPGFKHDHELDRASVAIHAWFGELVVGRQAIGLGRGVLFSAVDLFAPFSPLEVDRSWRRGVDAIHLELRLSDQVSVDGIAAGGHELSKSALVARVRAYVGDVDAALLFGRRAEDGFVGLTTSATVGDFELHGEAALFDTDGRGVVDTLGDADLVLKAVAGGSYNIDIGDGLAVFLEYHYSGFGLPSVRDDATLLLDAAFQQRFLRGDSQILGRHAVALMTSTLLFGEVQASINVVLNPQDSSGAVSPGLVWTYSDQVTLTLSGSIPWGAAPTMGAPQTEYGLVPTSIFLQAAIDD